VAEKSHYYPTPCSAQPCWGEGGVGCYLYGPEDLLNKNVSYPLIIIKSSLKMPFIVETPVTKKLAEIFCKAFWILINFLCQSCRTYFRFPKWGSLNSIAMRIRVNAHHGLFQAQHSFLIRGLGQEPYRLMAQGPTTQVCNPI
jgi:hypothetical protein